MYQSSSNVVPEITVTEYTPVSTPTITHDKLVGSQFVWPSSSISSAESTPENKPRPSQLSIQKYGSTHSLTPDSCCSSPGCTTPESETSPLLGSTRLRKRSMYRDKRYDDDVTGDSKFFEDKPVSTTAKYLNILKIVILIVLSCGFVIVYTAVEEHNLQYHQMSVSKIHPGNLSLDNFFDLDRPIVRISVVGSFLAKPVPGFQSDILTVSLNGELCNGSEMEFGKQYLILYPDELELKVPESSVNLLFSFGKADVCDAKLKFSTNKPTSVAFALNINDLPTTAEYGVYYASAILCGLYLLIIFELIHRTLAAMLAATAAVSVLSAIHDKPTLTEIMEWIDIETLCLLFGMMVMVAILCETGFFDYLAVFVYKIAKGRVWPLITLLCLATAFISAFLDNVTTILLLTPVTIRLSEVMNLNPKYVLIALVIFSNVGGTATAVGDPPNVIIVSNAEINEAGIDFTNFTTHMGLGVIFVLVVTYVFTIFMYRTCVKLPLEEHPEISEIKQEIRVWKRAAKGFSLYSRDEKSVRKRLTQKVHDLENLLKKRLYNVRSTDEDYRASLLELEENYKIKDWPLLIKTGCVLFCVIIMFFLHSTVPGMNISLGWIALMGAILLLILADDNDMEHIFSWVEWSTLIFFAALFVVMEALTKMGLLEFIGGITEDFILGLDKEARLPISIILVLWVSAIASSFIDNIPFTTVMLKIVLKLGKNPVLGLPLQPLVWALAFGACLGGNGTLIGASANVVCAGVAEQHGYRFSFLEFFKIGFPTMLVTTTVAMIYLIICHVAIGWNS